MTLKVFVQLKKLSVGKLPPSDWKIGRLRTPSDSQGRIGMGGMEAASEELPARYRGLHIPDSSLGSPNSTDR